MIKSIPTETLQEALLAVQDLRRKYLGWPQVTKYAGKSTGQYSELCPLCNFNRKIYKGDCYSLNGVRDKTCPWTWFEGATCIEMDYTGFTRLSRLSRLSRWETAIVEELALRQ